MSFRRGALEEGVVTPETIIHSYGSYPSATGFFIAGAGMGTRCNIHSGPWSNPAMSIFMRWDVVWGGPWAKYSKASAPVDITAWHGQRKSPALFHQRVEKTACRLAWHRGKPCRDYRPGFNLATPLQMLRGRHGSQRGRCIARIWSGDCFSDVRRSKRWNRSWCGAD
jgi:hypothetical protein